MAELALVSLYAGGVEVEVAVVCLGVEIDSCGTGFRSRRPFGGLHVAGCCWLLLAMAGYGWSLLAVAGCGWSLVAMAGT